MGVETRTFISNSQSGTKGPKASALSTGYFKVACAIGTAKRGPRRTGYFKVACPIGTAKRGPRSTGYFKVACAKKLAKPVLSGPPNAGPIAQPTSK